MSTKELLLNELPLKEYRILYEKNSVWAKRLATKLHILFAERFGVDIPMTERAEEVGEYVIVIGKTELTRLFILPHEFAVLMLHHTLQIVAEDAFAYEEAEKYLVNELFTEDRENISDNLGYYCDVSRSIRDTRRYAFEKKGKYRILSANICGSYGRKAPNDGSADAFKIERLQYFKETVKQYKPDIIIVQELASDWRKLTGMINHILPEIGYREVQNKGGNQNNTPIYYRADRLRPIESEWEIYTLENDWNTKSYTVAVFEDIETGESFGAFSTHFMWTVTGDKKPYYAGIREQNAKELSEAVLRFSNKYRCPMVGGGDLNSDPFEPCHEVLKKNGMRCAFDEAPIRAEIGTCHAGPKYDVEKKLLTTDMKDMYREGDFRRWTLDYIYGLGEAAIRLHDVPLSETALLTTDHTLVLADFDI